MIHIRTPVGKLNKSAEILNDFAPAAEIFLPTSAQEHLQPKINPTHAALDRSSFLHVALPASHAAAAALAAPSSSPLVMPVKTPLHSPVSHQARRDTARVQQSPACVFRPPVDENDSLLHDYPH
jgi:hypothetical protein